MTCKDCIHERVCEGSINTSSSVEKNCKFFKNKADFVEVVLCKDCAVPHNEWTGCPNLNGLIPPPNFYCAYGKKNDTK